MKYIGTFSANNCGIAGQSIAYTNKQKCINSVRSSSNANRFAGSECSWFVFDADGVCVAAGYTTASGQRCRIYGHELSYYDSNKD